MQPLLVVRSLRTFSDCAAEAWSSRGLSSEEKFRAPVNPTASARRRHPMLRTMEVDRTFGWRQ